MKGLNLKSTKGKLYYAIIPGILMHNQEHS